ncbi:MAG: hypothetical protein K2K89_01750 [Ruminococcus sp.]|nr:hypothetical protein [Ruminococcus sp.]
MKIVLNIEEFYRQMSEHEIKTIRQNFPHKFGIFLSYVCTNHTITLTDFRFTLFKVNIQEILPYNAVIVKFAFSPIPAASTVYKV